MDDAVIQAQALSGGNRPSCAGLLLLRVRLTEFALCLNQRASNAPLRLN